jgi:hypothetical protein
MNIKVKFLATRHGRRRVGAHREHSPVCVCESALACEAFGQLLGDSMLVDWSSSQYVCCRRRQVRRIAKLGSAYS